MIKQKWSLRELYREMEANPNNSVNKEQNKLDFAVKKAYGMKTDESILSFLLSLNEELFDQEQQGIVIQGPGLPDFITDRQKYFTKDCIGA